MSPGDDDGWDERAEDDLSAARGIAAAVVSTIAMALIVWVCASWLSR